MRKYLAIGHFKGNENITSVAMACTSAKNFRDNLGGNEFIPWAVITEKRMQTLEIVDEFELWDEVKKLVSNYRRWNDVADYIEQCWDIMEERMARA